MNNYVFNTTKEEETWQNVERPFEGDIACLDITRRGNVLIRMTLDEIWLGNKIKLDRWHRVKPGNNNTINQGEILYSVGDSPKLW